MHIARIHHAQITIPIGAEDAAKEFYCGILDLTEVPKPESLRSRGGFWLQLGEQQLHVGVEDKSTVPVTKAHIAYQVDDLAGWQSKLSASGCAILPGEPIPGYNRFETRDPFGNRLEFIQPIA
jgi:catechol 2,3-dioxygenase-like lactoylglutathione lyase family enzyme